MSVHVKEFFDKATWTLTYVVFDKSSRDAVVIDPVWDYDAAASVLSLQSVNTVVEFVRDQGLTVKLILETHAHADHVSGSQELKDVWPHARVCIGARITDVQEVFKKVYNLEADFPTDGRQFDCLLKDGETIQAGTLSIKTLYTPGHTPACASYVIDDKVFTGDALFMPDYGTGRCDFPAGSARALYNSVHEVLYRLPDHFEVFTAHDYQPNGRDLMFKSTIGEQKAKNIQLNSSTSLDEFVEFREQRDGTLAAPRLLLPSIQVNIEAGKLRPAENNGVSYLKIPVRIKK